MSQNLLYSTTPEGIQQAYADLEKMMARRRWLNSEKRNPAMLDEKGRRLNAQEAMAVKLAYSNEINELSSKIAPLKQFIEKQEATDPDYERKRFICEHASRLIVADGDMTNKDAISEAIKLAHEAEMQGVAFWSD